ncbi:hypothetical protein BSKO_13796 [Bryopsis sp. KO-2023]|nr:hypothetical protein BSKO_13796 [Bryopsis sp. KO-2023]
MEALLGTTSEVNPDHVGRVRVLVVGNTGCGKTSLTHFLSTGDVMVKTSTTVGCNVFVKLVEYPEERSSGGDPTRTRQYFVELWDVGAHPRYQQLRRLFYDQLNGVILVHDLTSPKSWSSLVSWATEVAGDGSFVAPFPTDLADKNMGGLPVPVLVVGNKADLAMGGPSAVMSRCWWWRWWPFSWIWAASIPKIPSGMNESKTVSASGLRGLVDQETVHNFFLQLIERRYYAGTTGRLTPETGFSHFAKSISRKNRGSGDALSDRIDGEDSVYDRL